MKKKSDDSSYWGKSLRALPWDKKEKTHSQTLISSTVHEWYDAKHRETSFEEIELINSIIINSCPYCGSARFIKAGHNGLLQRYKCSECDGRFSALTNTIFDSKKIPISEWIEYLMHLFEFHSIVTSARDNRNAEKTGKYWLVKVFEVLKDVQKDVKLKGRVYFDEMFFPVIKREEVLKDGKKLRGISRNKIAVACAFDEHGNILLISENTSKPSIKSTWAAMGNHIEEKSTLVHDGDTSHSILIEKLKLISEVHETKETKGLSDKENPLDPINDIHSLARRFMREHGGYDRSNLQDWMNLIWFILSEPKNRYEKIEKFINMAINTPARVKYRDVFHKKRVK